MISIITKYPFGGCIDTRIGGRKDNQDNSGYVDTPLGLLLIVCDGMGGGPGGRTASRLATDTILSLIETASPKALPLDALKYAVEQANEVLYTKAAENSELLGMGTTVIALLINDKAAYIAHVGDSRLYQIREGRCVFRTKDHSYVADLVRQGLISEEEARNHPQSNVITKALGVRPEVEVELEVVSFMAHDVFALCTDGIWGMLPEDQLIAEFSGSEEIEKLPPLIVDYIDAIGVETGGGHDNLTLAMLEPFGESMPGVTGNAATSCPAIFTQTSAHSLSENQFSVGSPTKKGVWTYKHSFWALFFCSISVALCVYYYQTHCMDEPLVPQSENANVPLEDNIEEEKIHDNTKDDNLNMDSLLENTITDSELLKKNIICHLDSLTKIKALKKSGDRDIREDGRKRKRQYVDEVIKPEVKSVPQTEGYKNNREKVDFILRLLDDRKTTGSDAKNGKATEECLNHVKKIKKHVNRLK